MIVKLRIAPVERWCGKFRLCTSLYHLSGRMVAIETASCESNEDGTGKQWMIVDEEIIAEIIKCDPLARYATRFWFCQHVLEVD